MSIGYMSETAVTAARNRVRMFDKHVLNPVMLRSEGFIVPLPYGVGVDKFVKPALAHR